MTDYSWMKPGVRAEIDCPGTKPHGEKVTIKGNIYIGIGEGDRNECVLVEEKRIGLQCQYLKPIDDTNYWDEWIEKTEWIKQPETA